MNNYFKNSDKKDWEYIRELREWKKTPKLILLILLTIIEATFFIIISMKIKFIADYMNKLVFLNLLNIDLINIGYKNISMIFLNGIFFSICLLVIVYSLGGFTIHMMYLYDLVKVIHYRKKEYKKYKK